MINFKVLLKSMTYLMIPTFVVFFLVFCWFLDWEAFKTFMLNRAGWAGFLRIFIVGLEFLLVWYIYEQNMQEYKLQNPEENAKKLNTTSYASDLSPTLQKNVSGTNGTYKLYEIATNKFLVEYS